MKNRDTLKDITSPQWINLKRDDRIIEVENVPWDLIVIDEVHKLGLKTGRFWKLGKRLVEASPNRDVLFLSATPHRGDPEDYINRLQLLDPYLTKGWAALDRRQFYEMTHGAILFRRTKEDVNKIYEGKENLQTCQILRRSNQRQRRRSRIHQTNGLIPKNKTT